MFFSSKHLIRNATHVQETAAELRRFLHMRKDDAGNIKSGPIEAGTKVADDQHQPLAAGKG